MPMYEVIEVGRGTIPVACPQFGTFVHPHLPDGMDRKRFAMRPVKDPDWRKREQQRFDDGTYQLPPWPEWVLQELRLGCPGHFMHISTKDPTKLSFTESEEKGEVDRQTTIAPGRYLERYARYRSNKWNGEGWHVPLETENKWIDDDTIRLFATMLLPPGALKYASTPDEIERVYELGPRSCMSGPAENFNSSVHPARIYGAGDLQVAYFEPEEDNISARVLIWPEKKVYGRVYDNGSDCIGKMLDDLGYKKGSLVGAKLLKIMDDDCYVAPYIDYHYYMEDEGEYCVISTSGIHCAETNGYASSGVYCCHCEDHYHSSQVEEWNGNTYCEGCLSRVTFWCEGYEERYDRDEMASEYVNGIGTVCQDYFDNHCFTCERTHRSYRHDDEEAIVMANGEVWSRRAVDRGASLCVKTGEYYPDDEVVTLVDTDETVFVEWAEANAYQKDGDYYLDDPDQLNLTLEINEAA